MPVTTSHFMHTRKFAAGLGIWVVTAVIAITVGTVTVMPPQTRELAWLLMRVVWRLLPPLVWAAALGIVALWAWCLRHLWRVPTAGRLVH